MYLSGPFILQNFYKKNLRVDSEWWESALFLGPKHPICLEQNIFWYKPLLLLSSTYSPFHCAKFKRHLTMDPELWRCTIFGAKVVHLPQIKLFSGNLLMSLVSFIHAYLHAKNQSGINLLVKYWWFKNTEISLAESHFCFYWRTRFFPSMQFSQDVNEP